MKVKGLLTVATVTLTALLATACGKSLPTKLMGKPYT